MKHFRAAGDGIKAEDLSIPTGISGVKLEVCP